MRIGILGSGLMGGKLGTIKVADLKAQIDANRDLSVSLDFDPEPARAM